MKPSRLERVTVDTTVQPKAIAFPWVVLHGMLAARSRIVPGLRRTLRAAGTGVSAAGTTEDRSRKLYALHVPEVECLAKTHKRYECGVKVSVAGTNREGLVLGMTALSGNPYDGHTLTTAIAQVERLTGVAVARAYVDRGYRGHGLDNQRASSPASVAA